MIMIRMLVKLVMAVCVVLAVLLLWRARDSVWVQQVLHHFPWFSGKTPARARRVVVQAQIDNILAVAEILQVAYGRYPATLEEMVRPTEKDADSPSVLLDARPLDPWGHEYLYALVDGVPEVTCLGSDGARGGEGEAEDVIQQAGAPDRREGSSPRPSEKP